jgi:hypothetical protein
MIEVVRPEVTWRWAATRNRLEGAVQADRARRCCVHNEAVGADRPGRRREVANTLADLIIGGPLVTEVEGQGRRAA